MLLLVVHAVVLLRLIMIPLLTYFIGFLIYQSRLDNKEISANVEQVCSSTLLDENGKKRVMLWI